MMNRAMKKPHTCLALTILMIIISTASIEASGGFSIDLIHRDSVQSPTLYSASERVRNALQRSFIRAKTLVDDNEKVASTEIVPDKGEYLMKLSLGTPPVETLAIADTGSDLTWVQCQPCTRCFNQTAPIFQPKRSSTYKQIPCTSPTCAALPRNSCRGATCMYTMLYGDFSYSMGDLSTETVKLGPASIPGVVMGCGHDDRGTFGAGASGIVGLGGGKVSLITQMGSSIQGKFSYCLVPYVGSSSRPSKMSFGADAVVSGAGVVSTPIVAKTPKTFYFLTLEGMTVGNQRLDSVSSSSLNDSKVTGEGNIIIDSGTTLTFLPPQLYYQVQSSVRKQVTMKEIKDPQSLLSLCFQSTGDGPVKVPAMTAHFRGADVKLSPKNTFVRTSASSLCLAFAPANSFAIYGNIAQMDFLVGYDLVKKTVSFKATDCTKLSMVDDAE